MLFRQHHRAAVLAAVLLAVLALTSGAVSAANPAELLRLLALMAIAYLMALFPDLDTSSIPQRWFLRLLFIGLAVLCYLGEPGWFACLALLALTPLLHRHRGWTHWWITPWILSLVWFTANEWQHQLQPLPGFQWSGVWRLLLANWILPAAIVIGHYTHLLLDTPRNRNRR